MIKISGTENTVLLLGVEISPDRNQMVARALIDVDFGRIVRIHQISGIDGRDLLAVPQIGMVAYIKDGRVDLSNIDQDEFTECIVEVAESLQFLRRHNIDFSQIDQDEDEDGYLMTDESLVQVHMDEQRKNGILVEDTNRKRGF